MALRAEARPPPTTTRTPPTEATTTSSTATSSTATSSSRTSSCAPASDSYQAGSTGGTQAPADPALSSRRPQSAERVRRGIVDPSNPDVPATPSAEEQFLAKGAKRKVKNTEAALRKAGFNPGKVDGALSERSREALRQFQGSMGLEPTGELDQKTYDRLKGVSKRMRKWENSQGPGQRSANILKQERRLKRLGYDPGKVDGVYSKDTAQAVRDFKADQDNLKSESGLLGKNARQTLQRENAAFNHDPYRARVKDTKEQARADKKTAEAVRREHNDGTVGLREGMKGGAVAHVQKHLRAAGYNPKNVDGVFDERTEAAVKQFQKHSGLEPTGVVNGRTWNKLRHAQMEADGAFDPSQRVGERSRAVKRTEQRLKRLGYNPGKVDGIYTERTQNAVDRFRKKEHLGHIGGGVTSRVSKRMTKAAHRIDIPKTANAPFGIVDLSTERGREVFRKAAKLVGLPQSWANDPGLRNLVNHESGGIVGRPNYTYGSRATNPSQWDDIHRELKNGRITAASSATGLGQLLSYNVERYYPKGLKGIGDPVQEAAGMLRYIKERYGNPRIAWGNHSANPNRHQGVPVIYTAEGY